MYYAIGVIRECMEDYCVPMPSLKEIDNKFVNEGKANVLKNIREYDSVITETNPENVVIEKLINGRWRRMNDFIITDPLILDFNIEELFLREEPIKILHVLYNHFEKYLDRDYVSEIFKATIKSMRLKDGEFLDLFPLCSYEEQREIRLYLGKRFNLNEIFDNKKYQRVLSEKAS